MADDENNMERSRKAKDDFEEKKRTLSKYTTQADKDEVSYDDVYICDWTELFFSGEFIARNEGTVGRWLLIFVHHIMMICEAGSLPPYRALCNTCRWQHQLLQKMEQRTSNTTM